MLPRPSHSLQAQLLPITFAFGFLPSIYAPNPPSASPCSLGLLANRVKDQRLAAIVATLCDKLINGKKEQQRDVAALGLKTVVGELAADRAATLVRTATPLLVEGLKATRVGGHEQGWGGGASLGWNAGVV
jgi:hypothetical protein